MQCVSGACLFLFVALVLTFLPQLSADCAMQNYCNGHGTCLNSTSSCACYDGWGSENDVAFYKAPDCSQRVCPSDRAWADIPTGPQTAHAVMECSNRGVCDRKTGICKCFDGFTGSACQRTACPNECSGHGVCVSLKQMARMSNALPLAPNTYYEGAEDGSTWDEDKIYGCVCDSSWSVGLGAGETQEPEWFGPDCSLRHCPSGDNPRTVRDETNCTNVQAANSQYRGENGNLCHYDCGGQGLCDYKTGTCKCFDGYYGLSCTIIDPTAIYNHWRAGAPESTDSAVNAYFDDDL